MNLSKIILGGLEDQIWVFSRAWWIKNFADNKYFSDFLGYPFGHSFTKPWQTNQPLFSVTFDGLIQFFNPILFVNIYSILSILLTLIFSYVFFKQFKFKRFISLGLSLILAFSPYTYVHVGIHPALSQVWPLLLFLIIFFKSQKQKGFKWTVLSGLSLSMATLINNYLGYFGLLFIFTYIFSKALIYKVSKVKYLHKTMVMNYLVILSTFFITTGVILLPFIKANYNIFPKDKVPTLYANTSTDTTNINGEKTAISTNTWKTVSPSNTKNFQNPRHVNRTFEDFFYFTSRPWYYFFPSPENPWFGNVTKKIINWLQNDWGYWLTTNYFPSEHTTSYLGWTNFFFAIIGGIHIIKKIQKQKKVKTKKWTREMKLLTLGLVAIGLILFTMPPYFTISLKKVYMPSFLLWKVFPMFRSLVRLGIVILLIELIFTGYGYSVLLHHIKQKIKKVKHMKLKQFLMGSKIKWNITQLYIISPFILLSLIEFYVPIKITNVSTPPAVFTYMRKNTPKNSSFAIYPYGKATETLFWISEYQRGFANPRGFAKPEFGFDSLEFTKNLATCKGILESRNLGLTYIIYFHRAYEQPKEKQKAEKFFKNNRLLEPEITFEEKEPNKKDLGFWNKYVKITNSGNSVSNSAILYKIKQDIDYEKEKEVCFKEIEKVKLKEDETKNN